MESVTLVTVDNKIQPLMPQLPPTVGKKSAPEPSLQGKLLAAGLGACMADLVTFPLDTAKVRLQIQGESLASSSAALGNRAVGYLPKANYKGVLGTICTITRHEGLRALYNGIVPGLQRQMVFASIRIGFYDNVKGFYQQQLGAQGGAAGVATRILAGITTGALAVSVGQPTDVVKVRMQASTAGQVRYSGSLVAYKSIATNEGIRGLWKGTAPNIARTTIVNACELVSYDLIKERILLMGLLSDNLPCHFVSAFGAGFITTCVASPVDVIKTRFMNSGPGQYAGILDCARQMFQNEGARAFYKGFMPSFLRLASWNVAMFVCYEQLKRAFASNKQQNIPQIAITMPASSKHV